MLQKVFLAQVCGCVSECESVMFRLYLHFIFYFLNFIYLKKSLHPVWGLKSSPRSRVAGSSNWAHQAPLYLHFGREILWFLERWDRARRRGSKTSEEVWQQSQKMSKEFYHSISRSNGDGKEKCRFKRYLGGQVHKVLKHLDRGGEEKRGVLVHSQISNLSNWVDSGWCPPLRQRRQEEEEMWETSFW